MNVDGSLSERELTLVKLPDYVAREIHRMIDESIEEKDPSMSGCKLASIIVGGDQDELELADGAVAGAAPREYTLEKQGERPQTFVISQQNGQNKVEGRVSTTYSARPKRRHSELDPQYTTVRRSDPEESKPAMQAKLDTSRQLRVSRLDVEKKLMKTRERKKLNLSTQEFLEQRDALEAKLFSKFEAQPYWKTADLMNVMCLSGPQLSQILKEIATLNAAGPYKQHWSLKKEYRTGPKE